MNLPDMLARAERLERRCALVKGRLDAAAIEHDTLLGEVGLAKGRLELAPDVEAFVANWQTKIHARSVGVMEQLLTALLQDVVPGDKRAAFTLSTERGAPALDIELITDGEREDILEGHGGAVTNVVSAGLRFIALSRSGARKFIALDEADCWLSEWRVGLFSNVLSKVSENLGVQTLVISHYDLSHFEEVAYPIKLSVDETCSVRVEPIRELPTWDANQPGIRWLRLINFRKHADTTVPLAPGITALVGDVDVGKSTIISALRAIAYGESSDTVIRHKTPYAEVQVHIEKGQTLVWRRVRKGSPKTRYTLLDKDGAIVREENMARGAPNWVADVLGIVKSDDLDIQVGSQKKPVFLLDESASRRAALLSVGRESGYLVAMLEAHRDEVKLDRERVRKGEERLGCLLGVLKNSTEVASLVSKSEETAAAVKGLIARSASLAALEEKLRQASVRLAKVSQLEAALADLIIPEVPTSLKPTSELLRAIDRLHGLSVKTTYTLDTVRLPVLPVLHPVEGLLEKGKALARLERVVGLASRLPFKCDLPGLRNTPELQQKLKLISDLTQLENKLRIQLESEVAAIQKAHAELEHTIQAMGGLCPLCNHAIESGDVLYVHAT